MGVSPGCPTAPQLTMLPPLSLLCLVVTLPLVFTAPSKKENEVVNEMLDVVESGLDQGQDARARLLMAMVPLSQTSTTVITETETSTVTPSCVSAVGSTFSECTGGWYTTSTST